MGMQRWERTLAWYREQGILPWEQCAGASGFPVTTADDQRGGIDSGAIERLLAQVLG
jgi:hypothetical protein